MKYKEIDQIFIDKKFKKDKGPKKDPNMPKNNRINFDLSWALEFKNNINMNSCGVKALYSLDVQNPNKVSLSLA
jgi:hypothetical protein